MIITLIRTMPGTLLDVNPMGLLYSHTVPKKTTPSEEILRAHGYKVTPPRVAVLDVLGRAKQPLSVRALMKALSAKNIGQASAYRTLQLLVAKDVVRPVDLRHDHIHYELVPQDDHHHAICTKCGRVADITGCDVGPLVRAAKRTAAFDSISHHAIELFGVCHRCAVQKK
jgi:Fe2+ or Zn2+ uptake regulation protein